MATKVILHKTMDWNKVRIFRTDDDNIIMVVKFKEGVATLVPTYNSTIQQNIKLAVGCFLLGSNFEEELCKAYNKDEKLKEIHFMLNRVTVIVNRDNLNTDLLYKQWVAGILEYTRIERSECSKILKTSYDVIVFDDFLKNLIKNKKIKLKDSARAKKIWKNEEKKFIENSVDSYFPVAQRWAIYMQYLLEVKGKSIMEIAEETFESCNIEFYYTSNYQKSDVRNNCIALLIDTWEYGEELKKWDYNNNIPKNFN